MTIIFDMDETLGYFTEIGQLYHILSQIQDISQSQFNQWLDLYPTLLRPDILPTCALILQHNCKVILYTNNTGSKKWVHAIAGYIEYRLGQPFFHYILHGYTPGDEKHPSGRTTYYKTMQDIYRCTSISPNTRLCFIDDQDHPYMKHSNVTYLRIPPYKYPPMDVVQPLLSSKLGINLTKIPRAVQQLYLSLPTPHVYTHSPFSLLSFIQQFFAYTRKA